MAAAQQIGASPAAGCFVVGEPGAVRKDPCGALPWESMTDFASLTALDLAAAYRRGETTPAAAVDFFLTRIAARNERLGALVTVTADAARAAARDATTRLAAGEDLPPLFGVPTAIKDLNATAGVPTSFGSAAYAGFVPDISDEVVLRLQRTGMISLGKSNTPEFGLPSYTEPDASVAPPARTPYDVTRSAGGSSGGAGAAVAGGLVPIAQGSDGGGSIRIPASVCGLVGFKPSRGRVSTAPNFGDIAGLSAVGPLALSVRDAAAMLDVLAGPAVGEPTWAPPVPDGSSYVAWCDHPVGRLRIGRFADAVFAPGGVDEQVLDAYEVAAQLLEHLGHEVVDVPAPIPAGAMDIFQVVWAVGAATAPIPPGAEGKLLPLTRWLRGRGADVSAAEYVGALVGLRQVAARAIAALAEFDAVLTPTLAQLPAAIGSIRDDDDPAGDFAAQVAFTPFTSQWNVTGMPAVSLPMAWTNEGLPIGVMLAGRPAADHQLFALAAQIERAVTADGPLWQRPPLRI